MVSRIALLCCALLLTALPAAWAESPSAPTSAGCETKALFSSLKQPDLEALSPLADAQTKAGTCCTQQDRLDCFSNTPEGCYVEQFYCYQGWFCYCGYFCN